MNKTPKISFVAVGRNDNYGGDFLYRLNLFIQNLVELCNRHRLAAELVLVEWNPPADRAPLAEAISWPAVAPGGMCVRIVQVPRALHETLPRSDKLPVFEYIGKNVGVRRARGEYVLVTNPDILFSDGLVRALGGDLSRRCYYRTARYDVKTPIPPGSADFQLAYCRSHILRRLGYVYSPPAWDLWSRCNPFERARCLAGFAKWMLRYRCWLPPYANAAGDFFLMHRSGWEELRGYPELKSHSHMDSYLTFCAHASGRRLKILRGDQVYLYHQDHGREEHARRPTTDYAECLRLGREMVRARRATIFNDEHWGLAAASLPECTIGLGAAANFVPAASGSLRAPAAPSYAELT